MTAVNLADLAEENMLRSIECWVRAAGGYFQEEDGIYSSTAPVPMRSFNQVILRRAVRAEDLRRALARFGGRERFRLRVREDRGMDEAVLAECGLARRGGIPSMVLEAPVRQELAVHHVREARDEATLADHVQVVAAAFDWDSPDLGAVFTAKLLMDESWQAWVAYEDVEPVATAQLATTGDVGGVYYVGTLDGYRGKGYGALTTRIAVDEAARKGCQMVGLQASPVGRPVYERLGFRVVAEYATYVPG
ncbi:MAG TPA: GNAT family N-acetyltransferase [Dehalococcoidia bacterium]|nr:GNAT family N-acetyltransferase [Dehalococcoidia bacterium]